MADPDYAAFFLDTSGFVVMYELLEIQHPSFSQDFRVVRNAPLGLTVQYASNPGVDVVYTYYPLEISPLETTANMDQSISVKIGELGGLLQAELDLVSADDLFKIKPGLIYRCYRSDDLTQELYGPISLQINSIVFNQKGAQFSARAKIVDTTRTGETYQIPRFQMMKNIGTA